MNGDPAVVRLEGIDLLVVGLFVLVIGEVVLARVAVLRKFNIPSAVIGGLVSSIALGAAGALGLYKFEFGTELRGLLLLVFFSAIGASIKFRELRGVARSLLVLFVLAGALLIFQNMVGSAIAAAFGYHPAEGLLAGSISFMGGHGTGIAWSAIFADRFGIQNPEQGALTLATLGLVAAGLTGGPLAELLIRRHGLQDGTVAQTGPEDSPEEKIAWHGLHPSMLATGILIAAGVYIAPIASAALAGLGVTLPAFVVALLAGAVLTNLADVGRVKLSNPANDVVGDIALQLFLVISVMNIHLAHVVDVAVPILAVFVLQVLLVAVFVYFTIFPVMGRNYESAVICAGFTGFSLGSSLIGIGNMRAVTRKYGMAPAAFIIIPVVGSFLIDIFNSFVLQLYLLSSVLE